MQAPKRATLNLIMRAALSLLLMGVLVYSIGSIAIIDRMRAVPWQTLAIVVVLLAGHVLIITPRWANILCALGYRLSNLSLIGSVFFGFLFNQLLPTAVGGDVIRAWRAHQLGVPWEISIHSVLFDRASAIVVVFVAALILLPFADPLALDGEMLAMAVLTTLAGMTLIGGGALLLAMRFAPAFVAKIGRVLAGLKRSVGDLVHHPSLLLVIGVLAILNQILVLVSIWLLAKALNLQISPVDFAMVILIATLVSVVPISIAGWGVREGSLVYLFGAYNVPPDVAIAVSILFGACLTLASAPAALMLLRGFGPASPHENVSTSADGNVSY